jgi:hypothetical protein
MQTTGEGSRPRDPFRPALGADTPGTSRNERQGAVVYGVPRQRGALREPGLPTLTCNY